MEYTYNQTEYGSIDEMMSAETHHPDNPLSPPELSTEVIYLFIFLAITALFLMFGGKK